MTTTILGPFMEKVIGAIWDDKRLLFLVCIVGLVAWKGWVWADDKHDGLVSQSEFVQFENRVEEGFDDSAIRDAKNTVLLAKMHLRLATATQATENELKDLQDYYENAKKYKECLRTNGPNCEHIKEPE